MSSTILRQTIIMMILIIAGIICYKTKIISKNTNKDLSRFVLQVINPIVIFTSYQMEYRAELVRNLFITFGISIAAYVIMIALTYVMIRKKKDREIEIERFSTIYSNCGFMGIPLMNALFGSVGVFYLTAFITVFNLIVWTHGIILISGERDFKKVIKVFYSPTIIAIVLGIITFFARIEIPSVPLQALEFLADMNTPMAMIVSGVTMAETDIFKLLKKSRVYYICALKLLVIPVILVFILSLLNIDEKVRMTVIVASSAPPAAMCTLQCIRYNKNSLYASEIFTAGTLLSTFSLPVIVKITEFCTKISLF